jgi:DNA-binding CsgD family transcriptional regulator
MNITYRPKTGSVLGRNNRERIKRYLERNPDATGVDIARSIGISLNSTYVHLRKINEGK